MTKRKVFALVAVVVMVLSVGGLFLALSFHETKQDALIDYLDSKSVSYSDRQTMLTLADTLCDLDSRGINTTEYLETAFNRKDAFAIQNGVLNSGYCK
jgi:hypothetical protein